MTFDEIKALRKALGEMTGVKNPDERLKNSIEYNLKKLRELEKAQAEKKSKKQPKKKTKKKTKSNPLKIGTTV